MWDIRQDWKDEKTEYDTVITSRYLSFTRIG